MNKQRLTYLVVFSIFSILFLIAIQLYWIKTSVATQQRKFDQTVMEVMQEVVNKIEREEAVTRVTSSILDGNQIEALFGKDSVLTIEKGLKKEIEYAESDPRQLIKTKSDELRLEFRKPQINDSSFLIIRETKKNVLSSNVNLNSSYEAEDKDSLLQKELKKKASLISNIVNELALISISRNFEEKISYNQIDSLFARELEKSGIKAEYVFDILDVETQNLVFSEEKELNAGLKNTPYKIELFPNDFMKSDAILLYFPNQVNWVLKNSWKVLLISFLLICILILLFYSSIATIYKQKKLSKVKNDFINNMTHELKTPISTISLACEALNDPSLSLNQQRHDSYLGMIKDENKRLSVLVENVLKSAAWDSSVIKLDLKKQNIHDLIERVVKSFEIQISKKGGTLQLALNAKKPWAFVDQVHMSNVIYNLLDNANKYGGETPLIEIETYNQDNVIFVSIKDDGIGISKQDQKKIFDKFYRVSTGNLHDVKGFGLGLNYVKRIIDLHHGDIEIESKKNKGTKITLKLENYGQE